MPRKRNFDKTVVLDKIMISFWENGFQDTGFRELTAVTGVQSQSLVNAFGSKQDLFVQAMDHYVTVASDMADKIVTSDHTNDQKLADLLILDWGKLPYPSGCMVISSLGEADQLTPQLDAVANRLYAHLTSCFQQVLTAMQTDLRPGLSPAATAALLLTVHNGIQVAVQDNQYPANVRQLIATTLTSLKK